MAKDNTTIDIELTGAIIQNNSKQTVSGTNYKLYAPQHFASPYNMTQGTVYYKIEPSFMIKMNVTKMHLFYPSTAGGYKEFTGPLPGFPSTVYPVIVSTTSDFPENTSITAKVSIPDDNTVSGVDSSKNWKIVIKMTPIAKPTPKLIQKLTSCTSSFSGTTVTVGSEISITLQADAGGTFEDNVQIGYYDDLGIWKAEKNYPASHTSTMTITWVPQKNTDYTLSASAVVPVQIDVVLKLTNCSLDPTYTKVNESTPQKWVATPTTGYKFDNTTKPSITYSGDWGDGSVDSTSTLNTNGTLSINFTAPSYNNDGATSMTLTLSAIKGETTPQPTQPTETVPDYIFDDEFLENASITEIKNEKFPSNITQIHLTATQKFLFDGGIFYVDKNNEIKLIAKIPKTNGTTAVSDKFDISSLPNITSIEKTKIYVCCEAQNSTYQQTSKFNAVNTAVYLNDVKISDGDKTGEGLFHVRLQAIDNCIFDKTGSQWFMDSLGMGKEFSILPNNKNVLEYDTFISQNGFFNLDISATKQTLVDTGGYVNIYKTNTKEITALSKEIILNNSGSSPSLLDSTAYIKAYYRIPFNISAENLQPNVNFLLANTKSTTTTTQVTSDTLTFALGNIKVPEKYNNTFDYQNTTCVLYLPFVDSIKLVPTDVINKTLSVNYIMDMYTGNVTVNVINSNHDTIYSKDFKLSTDLPFLQVNNLNQTGKIVNTYNNAINQAYLLVTRNIPVKQQFGYPTKEQGQLKNYHGYIECSDIQLNSLADSDDLNIIKGLLQKGVFIK